MIKLAEQYPNYGFEKHVGYGTALHKQALIKYGACPEHRRSFRPIRELIEQEGRDIIDEQVDPEYDEINHNQTSGQLAENAILHFLENQGHQIIAHNYKTKTYEIDLISTFEHRIYFTEVKYRKNSTHGTPLNQITPEKYAQMNFAAESFLASHPEFANFAPQLAAGTVGGPDFKIEDWFSIL